MPLANRTRAGRRDCGGGAPFCSALRAAQCEAEKGRASQKQRSDFLAAPVHMAPPGRQKSEREFCLFGGVLFVRRAAPYGGLAVLARLAAVMRAFAPGAPAFFLQALHTRGDSLAPSVLFACRAFVCAVPSCFGCLFACSTLFARAFFSYLLPFPVWLLPLKLLFICRSGRDGPLLSSEKKVDKDSRGALPLRTPIPVPCGRSPLSPRCWPA